jgi:hypothetical protein
MERRVTVNDRIDRVELEVPEGTEADERLARGNSREPQGPCLYLGAAGERCSRPAVEGGYCAKHHTDPDLRPAGRSYTRVLVATVALVIIIWPYVADLVRDVMRWLGAPR